MDAHDNHFNTQTQVSDLEEQRKYNEMFRDLVFKNSVP